MYAFDRRTDFFWVYQGDEMSVIRRSVLEDLLRRPQSQTGAQDLMTRAQSEESR